jgi:hypothetical protein
MTDRRTGGDRRSTGRGSVTVEIEWQGRGERRAGTLSDVSRAGCFVLTGGTVLDGSPVRLFVPLANGTTAEFTGVVANHVADIGFAVRFDVLSAVQTEMIDRLRESA